MKKTVLIGAAALLSAGSLLAQQYDIYVSGSTAFRNNCYDACSKLFDGGAPVSINNDGTSPANKSTFWTMSGTCSNLLVGAGLTSGPGTGSNSTVVIHGWFNGSVSGLFALGQKYPAVFYKLSTPGDRTLVTNTATCAFSDVDSKVTIWPLSSSSYIERHVCVQPFAFVKSVASAMSTVSNMNYQTFNTMIPASSTALSQFTGNASDSNTVYLVERTLDSGTHASSFAEAQFFGAVNSIYYYDVVGNTGYYLAVTNQYNNTTQLGQLLLAGGFGFGYVNGGDVANTLKVSTGGASTNNLAVGYLGFADSKGIGPANWANVIAYNGEYPCKNWVPGATPATNDFSPVIYGKYSLWDYEVLAWPKSAQYGTYSDQLMPYSAVNVLLSKLAGYTTGGSFVGGVGSIDNEVLLSQPTASATFPPTAIRLGDMHCSRQNDGGPIAPF